MHMARDKGEQQQAMLGLRLMTAVQRQGLSVYELAKRAELPVSVVQKLCAGAGKQPSFWTLVALANVLGLSLDTLAGRDSTDTTTPTAASPPPPRQRPRQATSVG
jgi:ribosome-binding protein aMBF1 (putative translation factor)